MSEWVRFILSVAAGICACIPLVVKLIKYVKKASESKKWSQVVSLVTDLMIEAEAMFSTGADRKTWVLRMVEASAAKLNVAVDLLAVSELIDELCAMSKKVNAPACDPATNE